MGKKSAAMQEIIDGKDVEIAALTERLSALQEELSDLRNDDADKRKSWEMKEKALNMELEALQHEVEVITEMHERILLRVQADNAALATRIPVKE